MEGTDAILIVDLRSVETESFNSLSPVTMGMKIQTTVVVLSVDRKSVGTVLLKLRSSVMMGILIHLMDARTVM